ncbi:MAG: c-type cytochrome [Deltaproteobacteria bacterium]|nr:c-type cytochrome [Deltaproteobacteria bacterium]
MVSSNVCLASTQIGKDIYQKRCSWCHGANGNGDGPAAAYLNPGPRDLTSGVFKWKSTPFDEPMPTDQDLRASIAGHKPATGTLAGLNGTSMPGWSDVLSDDEITSVIDYIKELGGLDPPALPSIELSGMTNPTDAEKARAKELFKDRCSECHGAEGRGDGTKRLKDDWGGRTWPRDLTKPWTFRAGSGVEAIYTRITVGIPGTQMPSFADTRSKKALTEAERWAVADYVASLANADTMPVAGAVARAARIETETPAMPDDPAWSKAAGAAFYLTPQLIADERLFTPTIDSIVVKALYNERDFFMLIEWHDRTKSLPGDSLAASLADGQVYPDGVAVQFPSALPDEDNATLPPFGMGGKEANGAVDIWFWQAQAKPGNNETLRILQASGPQKIKDMDTNASGVTAIGNYDKGVWRVVFKRPLKTQTDGMQFNGRRFITFSLAAWDGSNAERGSKHTLTPWLWMSMTGPPNKSIYFWPAAIGILSFAIIWLIFRNTVRRG